MLTTETQGMEPEFQDPDTKTEPGRSVRIQTAYSRHKATKNRQANVKEAKPKAMHSHKNYKPERRTHGQRTNLKPYTYTKMETRQTQNMSVRILLPKITEQDGQILTKTVLTHNAASVF